VGRGFVNDATQREAVEITGLRPSQSGRTVITYTDLDGKSKEFAGKPGDAAGPCPLFPGKQVAAAGWCTTYQKKA
jgi:hypothetical protein